MAAALVIYGRATAEGWMSGDDCNHTMLKDEESHLEILTPPPPSLNDELDLYNDR